MSETEGVTDVVSDSEPEVIDLLSDSVINMFLKHFNSHPSVRDKYLPKVGRWTTMMAEERYSYPILFLSLTLLGCG